MPLATTRPKQNARFPLQNRFTLPEAVLLTAPLALCLIAVIGHFVYPLTPSVLQTLKHALGLHAHDGAQGFADTRALMGLPNAADVLSNLPFLLWGVWGWLRLKTQAQELGQNHTQHTALQCFFAGLVCTAVGSMGYHYAPSDACLLWDRAGMGVAFAGMLGLAVGQTVSVRTGRITLVCALLGAALALGVWRATQDVLGWSVVQFGGMGLILACACAKPGAATKANVSLAMVIVFYALAKAFEAADDAVFHATSQLVSGHTLKHVMASFAALPVLASVSFAQTDRAKIAA